MNTSLILYWDYINTKLHKGKEDIMQCVIINTLIIMSPEKDISWIATTIPLQKNACNLINQLSLKSLDYEVLSMV